MYISLGVYEMEDGSAIYARELGELDPMNDELVAWTFDA
jgi:hypothetical protein